MSVDFPPSVTTIEADKDLKHLLRVLKLEAFHELDEEAQLALINECNPFLPKSDGNATDLRIVRLLLNLKRSPLPASVKDEIANALSIQPTGDWIKDLQINTFLLFPAATQLKVLESVMPLMATGVAYQTRSRLAGYLRSIKDANAIEQDAPVYGAIVQMLNRWDEPPF